MDIVRVDFRPQVQLNTKSANRGFQISIPNKAMHQAFADGAEPPSAFGRTPLDDSQSTQGWVSAGLPTLEKYSSPTPHLRLRQLVCPCGIQAVRTRELDAVDQVTAGSPRRTMRDVLAEFG